jgi:hypothetical protein
VSYVPDEPVDFVELLLLEVFSLFHLGDNFCEFSVVLPAFVFLLYCSEEKYVLFFELHVSHPIYYV